MKYIITVFFSLFFGVFTVMIVMTIYGEMNRSMELKSQLPSMMECALEQDMVRGIYGKEDLELFVNQFAEQLAVSWDTRSHIVIDVMQYEPELGILSLKVTAGYEKPFGGTGMVECERTVILNRLQE